MKYMIPLVLILLFACIAVGQETDSLSTVNDSLIQRLNEMSHEQEALIPEEKKVPLIYRTEEEIRLTKWFLLFGAFVLGLAFFLLYKFSHDLHNAFKYFIIVLLVLGMLLLIAVGFGEEQISPAVGLFGTIAGYLLGKTDSLTKKEKNENE